MPAGVFKETYLGVMAIARYPIHWAFGIIGSVLLVLLPFILPTYHIAFIVHLTIFFIGAVGLNLLSGLAGQISLTHAALMGLGAYMATYLALWGVHMIPAIYIAGLVAATISFFLGLPSFRLKGYYLAMASIAMQIVLEYVFSLINPHQYMNVPSEPKYLRIGGYEVYLGDGTPLYYFVVLVALIMGLFAVNLARSSVGRAFKAVRDNDVSAEIIGINVAHTKALAFTIAGFYAGVAGGLYALANPSINWEGFMLDTSIEYFAMILVGGLGRIIWGSLLGVVMIRGGWLSFEALLTDVLMGLGPEWAFLASAAKYLVLGSLVSIFLLAEPGGLIEVLRRIKEYLRLWPYSY